MKTAQIDILKVTKKADTYIVDYWDESCENENNVTMQISEDALIEFVDKEGYNQYVDSDWDIIPPSAYLDENLHEVIKDYITQNS